MPEQHHDRRTLERLREHLGRADGELRDTQHFLDPGSAEEAEMDIVHAAAAARLAVVTGLERVSSPVEEPEA
jgi:hypothetical protein